MARYAVAGRSVATAATVDNVGGALWNPHASRDIYIVELHYFKTVATGDFLQLIRSSTRGTQTLTVTPDVDNDFDRLIAPATAAVLDLTYSAQPTLQGPPMFRLPLAAAIGAGGIYVFPKAIRVPFGTGLACATPVATILQPADITYVFDD